MKALGLLLVSLAVALPVSAAGYTPSVPEINAGSASAAIALLSGGLLVLRSRNKK